MPGAAALFARLSVVSVAIVLLTGFAGYVVHYVSGGPLRAARAGALAAAQVQVPNRAAKADLLAPAPGSNFSPSFALGALLPNRSSAPLIIDTPAAAKETVGRADYELAIASAAPLPRNRPKTAAENWLLNDAQIAGIKSRLRLTAEQAELWPAVEAALHDVVRRHLQDRGSNRRRSAPRIEANSPEVLRLVEAALPLIRQLREDQKREIRQLVRVIGLETVASNI